MEKKGVVVQAKMIEELLKEKTNRSSSMIEDRHRRDLSGQSVRG
jgi:hypothetical protein